MLGAISFSTILLVGAFPGLYFGLYTCVGTKTCRGGRPGSYGHYEQDADTFANDWQMDFIKVGFSETKTQPRKL